MTKAGLIGRLCYLGILLGWVAVAQAQFGEEVGKNETGGVSGGTLGPSKTRTFRVGVTISAKNGPCDGIVAAIPIPVNWTEQQVKVAMEDIAPTAKVTFRPGQSGLKQMIVEIPHVNPGEVSKAILTLEITKSAIIAPSDTSVFVIPKNPPRDVRIHMGTSPNIESTNPKIKTFAKEAFEGQEGAWNQIESLYKAVREKVKFEPEKGRKGAIGALKDGKANRDDMTALFIASCRSMKIPARFVWVTDSCYAEFYLDEGKGKGVWLPAQVWGDKEEFGFVTDTRPILQKGDNLKIPESKEVYGFVPEKLTGRGGAPSAEFVRRLEDSLP